MKRIIEGIKKETGLTSSEIMVVGTIVTMLLVGWIGRSFSQPQGTHDKESAARVMAILDTLLSQNRAAPPPPAWSNAADTASKKDVRPSKTVQGKVRVNTASRAQLETLPGVGPAMAERIMEARKTSPFQTPEDLLKVSGIGPKKLEKMRPFIIVP
jgi:competence ComEA-like helix-hairpin-helix protein